VVLARDHRSLTSYRRVVRKVLNVVLISLLQWLLGSDRQADVWKSAGVSSTRSAPFPKNKHRPTAWGVKTGRRRLQAAPLAGGSPLKQP
jgi:hypothetical protein